MLPVFIPPRDFKTVTYFTVHFFHHWYNKGNLKIRGNSMAYPVETRGVEEQQHPFYVIRYVIKNGDEELLASVARYVHTGQGGRVQFLEPDLRKIRRMPDPVKQMSEVERVIKNEGARLAEEAKNKK
jgi:hypothetical protein